MPFSLIIWIYDEIRRYILRRYPGCKYSISILSCFVRVRSIDYSGMRISGVMI